MDTFNVSITVALLQYSFYILGLAFGPVVAAPCSEVFRRKAVYLFCSMLFALLPVSLGVLHRLLPAHFSQICLRPQSFDSRCGTNATDYRRFPKFEHQYANTLISSLFGSIQLTLLNTGPGSIADIWSPVEQAIPIAAYVTTPFLP